MELFAPSNFASPVQILRESAAFERDYSKGVQFLVQRRSENRLSGWIGYTLVYAEDRNVPVNLPYPFGSMFFPFSSYIPTLQDQRNTVNLFATYRLRPTLRLSAKNNYGSGFPVDTFAPVIRLGTYERLDLRADKSWLIGKCTLSLYGELLNATNHNNPIFMSLGFDSGGNVFLVTAKGVPATPTAGLAIDF